MPPGNFEQMLPSELQAAFKQQMESEDEINWNLPGSAFTPINGGASTSGQTVSPKDIFGDLTPSAPASSALTNLTSPDLDSPYALESYDTSPLFTNDGDIVGTDTWFPLFPESNENIASAEPIQRSVSNQSLDNSSSSGNSPLVIEHRRKSSIADKSPSGHPHSAVAGVKPRRRKGPLPPITVNDPCDKAAIKRARNTMAARDSRQRKLEHVATLEHRIAELEASCAKAEAERDEYKRLCINLGHHSNLSGS
jgi:hypothetical protein